jgi:hypothetical protein
VLGVSDAEKLGIIVLSVFVLAIQTANFDTTHMSSMK